MADSYDPSSILILIDENDSDSPNNYFKHGTYNGSPSWAPELYIEYTAGAAGVTVEPSTVDFQMAGVSPTLQAGGLLLPGTAAFQFAGVSASVEAIVRTIASTAQLQFATDQVVLVSVTKLFGNTAALNFSTDQGTITAVVRLIGNTAQLLFTTVDPSITVEGAAIEVGANTVTLNLAGVPVTIDVGGAPQYLSAETAQLLLSGVSPLLKTDIYLIATTAQLTLAAVDAIIEITGIGRGPDRKPRVEEWEEPEYLKQVREARKYISVEERQALLTQRTQFEDWADGQIEKKRSDMEQKQQEELIVVEAFLKGAFTMSDAEKELFVQQLKQAQADERREFDAQAGRERQRHKNLAKARFTQEEEKKRQAQIKATRQESVKKARQALRKKRTRKKR